MANPSAQATASMLHACSERLEALTSSGVDEGVALDRIWDCYEVAWEGLERHCYDPRDRLFESKLRTMATMANA